MSKKHMSREECKKDLLLACLKVLRHRQMTFSEESTDRVMRDIRTLRKRVVIADEDFEIAVFNAVNEVIND